MENAFYGYLLKKCFKLQNHSHFITAADTAEPETSLELKTFGKGTFLQHSGVSR